MLTNRPDFWETSAVVPLRAAVAGSFPTYLEVLLQQTQDRAVFLDRLRALTEFRELSL
jgi:hypothetical protein